MNRIFVGLLALLLLTACQSGASPAERAVQGFLQALADKNEAEVVSLICPDYETDALLELDSLALVRTSLKAVSCKQVGADDKGAQVVCQGSIEASYNGETRTFDLALRTYTVVNSGGDWLVCGYKK